MFGTVYILNPRIWIRWVSTYSPHIRNKKNHQDFDKGNRTMKSTKFCQKKIYRFCCSKVINRKKNREETEQHQFYCYKFWMRQQGRLNSNTVSSTLKYHDISTFNQCVCYSEICSEMCFMCSRVCPTLLYYIFILILKKNQK